MDQAVTARSVRKFFLQGKKRQPVTVQNATGMSLDELAESRGEGTGFFGRNLVTNESRDDPWDHAMGIFGAWDTLGP